MCKNIAHFALFRQVAAQSPFKATFQNAKLARWRMRCGRGSYWGTVRCERKQYAEIAQTSFQRELGSALVGSRSAATSAPSGRRQARLLRRQPTESRAPYYRRRGKGLVGRSPAPRSQPYFSFTCQRSRRVFAAERAPKNIVQNFVGFLH